ncbi:MAG: SH3 domain-containing protein [Sarcina sp.]
MNKNKIISLLLSGAMLATISGTTGAIVNNRKASNTSTKNITLLANNNQVSSTGYACVINGNNKLVLTNKQGQVISYLSVGEMLHIGQVSGNNTFVTVKSTGASGYIANVNMLNINNSTTNNITRMNRNGYVINVSSSVNLRQGPGMNTNVIEGLSNNTPIRITGKTGQWFRVSVNGTKGYIFEEYIAESNATVNVNPTTTVTTPVNVINTSNPNNKTTVTKTSAVINHGELQPNVPANPVTNHGELQPNVPANPVTNHGELQPNVQGKPVTNHGELQPNVQGKPVTNHGELQPNVQGKPVTNHGELQPNVQGKPVTNHGELQPNVPANPVTNHGELQPNVPANPVTNHGELQPNVQGKPVTNHGELQPNVQGKPVTNHGELQPNVQGKPVTNHGELQPNVQGKPVTNHGELQPNVPGKPMTNHGELQPNGTPNKPETKPNKPEVKPNKPEAKPNKPEVKPNKPETKPNKPEVKPNKPETKPNKPEVKPNKPETKPNKPVQKLPAPVIEGNNVTITEGQQFNNSMLNVTANENAKITFNDNNINTNVPGVYTINVTATNSQGTTSTKAFTVTVQEGAPTLTVQNVTITQGQTFNDSMLNAKASEGAKIVFDNLEFNANVPATYTIKVTATNNDGLSTVKYAEVTVKAKENSNYITGTVNSNAPSNIPVRSGNGTWAAPIQNVTVNPNQQVNIICNMNGWYKINDNGIIGFIPAIYVTPQGNVPNVSNVYNNGNSTKIADPYNYTLPEYVSAELKSYMSVEGKNLNKDQVNSVKDQLTNAINPQAASTMFEFLDAAQYRAVNETLLADVLSNQGVLSGEAQTFINAAKEYNIDPVALVSQIMLESAHGTSQLATGVKFKGEIVYNVSGANAVDSAPKLGGETYAYNHGWTSVSKAIYGAAKLLSTEYYHNTNIPSVTPYQLRFFNGPLADIWHQYGTAIYYAKSLGTLINQYSYLYDANDTFTFRVPEFQNTQQMQQLEAQDMMAIKSGNQN